MLFDTTSTAKVEGLAAFETSSSAHNSTSSAAEVPARGERRASRRTNLSLRLRVRPADPVDGDFEEVGSTLNATRSAFYFLTPNARYHKGMPLQVNFPFSPAASSMQLEQRGEVVRVARKADGYGVAVSLTAARVSKPAPEPIPAVVAITPEPVRVERRRFPRIPFIVPVNLTYDGSGAPIQARCSDLSLRGCFVDTMNPFPVGTKVDLEIRKAQKTFATQATVCSFIETVGMGLIFSALSADSLATLESWMSSSPQITEPAATMQVPVVQKQGEKDGSFGAALVRILDLKGVLTPSEVAELQQYLKN